MSDDNNGMGSSGDVDKLTGHEDDDEEEHDINEAEEGEDGDDDVMDGSESSVDNADATEQLEKEPLAKRTRIAYLKNVL